MEATMVRAQSNVISLLVTFIPIIIIVLLIAWFIIHLIKRVRSQPSASKMINGYGSLTNGMSEDQVISLLGQPTGRRKNGNITTLTWRRSEFKGVLRGGTKERSIMVDFDENGVCGWDSENMGML